MPGERTTRLTTDGNHEGKLRNKQRPSKMDLDDERRLLKEIIASLSGYT